MVYKAYKEKLNRIQGRMSTKTKILDTEASNLTASVQIKIRATK